MCSLKKEEVSMKRWNILYKIINICLVRKYLIMRLSDKEHFDVKHNYFIWHNNYKYNADAVQVFM